ncbi:ABC transporter ATP-binding protein [Mycoplasma corogypsi]|uniref:ABC transporter ATP-binding protein n=1 Tax=Mycoplasma corogypsi TaxID=2106 RepID=UPI003872BD1E
MFKILPTKIKMYFVIGVFFMLLNVAVAMFLPILISQFIPLLVPSGKMDTYNIHLFNNIVIYEGTNKECLAMLAILTSSSIFLFALTSLIGLLIIIWGGDNASKFYRDQLFKKYQLLSLKDISNLKIESLITRINDDVAVFWEFLVGASTALVRAPLYIVVGLVFAFLTDVSFAWSILLVIPALTIVIAIIFTKINPLLKKNRVNLDNITKEAEETINGVKFIKAYNLQDKQQMKFNLANSKWAYNEKKIFNTFSVATPAFFGIVNLIIVFILTAAAILIKTNAPSVNEQLLAKINVFIEYEFMIAMGVMLFAQFMGSFFRAKISSKRITEVLNTKYDDLKVNNGAKIVNLLSQVNNVKNYGIEFRNLNFKYFSESRDYALKDINFKIEGGQTLGIIGPTGSGKSTIANLLVNNMKYDNGNVLINNIEVKNIDTKELHDKVGIVYQDALLYSGTIRQNLTFAKENATDVELQKALENACAFDFIKTLPDRLEHHVAQRGKNLSGGQKQRLSIARTLLIDPKILILDDSTSALDNITTKKLIHNINNNYSCTTVIISQKINSIKHADKILVMDKGEIIAQGTHEQLLDSCIWYKEVAQNQLEQ